jgi:hypothetical protein
MSMSTAEKAPVVTGEHDDPDFEDKAQLIREH